MFIKIKMNAAMTSYQVHMLVLAIPFLTIIFYNRLSPSFRAFSLSIAFKLIPLLHVEATQVFGSKVDKPSEILIKTLNAIEYIELDIQNIEAPKIDDPIT